MDIDNEEHIFSNSSSSSDDEEDQTHLRRHSHPSAEKHGQTQDMATGTPTDADSRNSTPVEEPQRPIVMTARAYQIEMLEESLKQNIIVAVRWALSLPRQESQTFANLTLTDGHWKWQDSSVSSNSPRAVDSSR